MRRRYVFDDGGSARLEGGERRNEHKEDGGGLYVILLNLTKARSALCFRPVILNITISPVHDLRTVCTHTRVGIHVRVCEHGRTVLSSRRETYPHALPPFFVVEYVELVPVGVGVHVVASLHRLTEVGGHGRRGQHERSLQSALAL